jgi:hypothetical protein
VKVGEGKELDASVRKMGGIESDVSLDSKISEICDAGDVEICIFWTYLSEEQDEI